MSVDTTSFRGSRRQLWRVAVFVTCLVAVVTTLVPISVSLAWARTGAAEAPVDGSSTPAAQPGAAGAILATAELTAALSETFWVLDWGANTYLQIQADERYAGEHGVIYLEEGVWLSTFIVNQLGEAFDTGVYPALTGAYGSEPNPGIDGDPRVVILIYDFHSSTVDGSFNLYDIHPQNFTRSNHREMFYLNLQALLAEPGSGGVLAAHEFAHLITYYRDVMLDSAPNPAFEPHWIAEGFTTYGEHLAGYDLRVGSQLLSFTNDPNFGLTYWQGVRANYGASYAFMRYLADREGEEFMRALVEQPLDGTAGIDAALIGIGSADRFTTLFDDWILACFLDGRPPELAPYSFDGLVVSAQAVTPAGVPPIPGSAEVADFGAVYLDFPACSSEAVFQVVLDGDVWAPLQAALISWDSSGALVPSVGRLDLANPAVADTVTVPAGYDRHTLAVWARGTPGSAASYGFRFSGAPDPPGGVQFLDMGGDDHFYQYVATLLARGVINGKEIPSGSGLFFFAGADNVLRAQFAKMIMGAIELHTAEIDNLGDPSFNDVYPVYKGGVCQAYPYDYVEEAAALGIVNGYGNGAFGPYSPITRGQLVLMIIRGAAAAGKPLPPYTGATKVFADVPLSHPIYSEIMTAYSAGILNGSWGSDGRLYFYPYSSATRNHVAKMTANLIECLETP